MEEYSQEWAAKEAVEYGLQLPEAEQAEEE